jgi:endonuclease/exonuclease/phosphatase family metal-dependent hydrolase
MSVLGTTLEVFRVATACRPSGTSHPASELLPRNQVQIPEGDRRKVRVLNWNLLHAWKDNDKRLDVVARTLEAQQPDVVGLQEVSESWLMNRSNRAKVLAERLGLVWTYCGTNGIPRLWEEGLAVLARRGIVSTARRRLVGSLPRPLCARQVLIGETRLEDETPFAVASVHLGFPEQGEVENLEQALDAADLVAREVLGRGIPGVLIGDLNAPSSALSVRALTTGDVLGGEAPFVDAWAVAGSGPGITSTPMNPYTDAPQDPPQRIDYVLVLQGTCPAAIPVAAWVIGTHPTEDGIYGSDHFGIVVDLELRPPGTEMGSDSARIVAENLRARIARVRSRIRALRAEARSEVTVPCRSLVRNERGGYPGAASAQAFRDITLAKVRAAFAQPHLGANPAGGTREPR